MTDVLEITTPHDGVVVLTLNRPSKRNALNAELRQALIDALVAAEHDDTVRSVVIAGAGATFCAGFDLDELMTATDQSAVFEHSTKYHRGVYTFPKPLIAAVEGAAVAGGLDLALMCDQRVVAVGAKLGQPQVRMGVPAAYELVRTVLTESAARRLCLTGQTVRAEDALSIGLVDVLVDPGEVLERAVELAIEIAAVAGAVAMKRAFVAAQPDLFG